MRKFIAIFLLLLLGTIGHSQQVTTIVSPIVSPIVDVPTVIGGGGGPAGDAYFRPGGTNYYFRPGGTDYYLRP